jgi:deoxyribonuclease V
VQEAKLIQGQLRLLLRAADDLDPHPVRVVAGVDAAYVERLEGSTLACAAAVALSFPTLEPLAAHVVTAPVDFPYVPGLFAFREMPALVEALRGLQVVPDVVLVDAHGFAHPHRFGAACHLGVLIDRPTIGCAKSRLVGHYDPPGPEFGARSALSADGEIIGTVVRTRPGGVPLFVSIGHRVSLETAVQVVLACCRGASTMAEPTRRADVLSKEAARRLRMTRSEAGPRRV